MTKHPARTMSFPDLLAGLADARSRGSVHRRYDPATNLSLWVYSNACVYDDLWDTFSVMSRGLILDEEREHVVATPFPKFFNAGEKNGVIPDLPFEAFEKVDGSLIIIFHHGDAWRTATKGSFDSDQARWARQRIDAIDTSSLVPGTTYLAEAVYPENVIVVRYAEAALVMLAAYAEDGSELTFDEVEAAAQGLGWRAARRHAFASVADMVKHAELLPATDEGFVVRFTDGLRLKLKGAEYRRIHALISRCTPLAMWEAMLAGDDMIAIRKDLPEEFWSDFDQITGLLQAQVATIEAAVMRLAEATSHLSDKEIGLSLKTMDKVAAPYLFAYRKGGFNAKVKDAIFKSIRPTGNRLDGYEPSYAMARVAEEAA